MRVLRMGSGFKVGGLAIMAMAMAGTAAMAGSKCALPVEVTAIQAAAVQQQLMVAALTCNEVTNFNAFQTSFSKELRTSDHRLQAMFRRLFGAGRGTDEYHAFKTRLANDSSIRSIHDNAGYCHEAQLVFAAALSPDKPTLANFVSGVAVHEDNPVDSCEIRVATGLEGAKAAPNVAPKPNPLRIAALAPAPVESGPAAAQGPSAGPAAQQAPMPSGATATAPLSSAAPQAQAAPAKPAEPEKKHSGWFSNLFN